VTLEPSGSKVEGRVSAGGNTVTIEVELVKELSDKDQRT
jgi:hypothetical protein